MTRVEIDAEAIPEELKERDQWLLWDRSNHTPRQPHWRGDFRGISWSDPDEWHSFEEAVEAAREKESWGIGYVTAADNDDHSRGIYGVIDVDGGADEEDNPREWLPGLQSLVGEGGAYVEWSPSHDEEGQSGLHIPVWNIDVPDWWSDTDHPDEEHTGVDVLTNKFCTFTGDVEIAGDALEHHDGVEEWLADAYEALTGETAPPRENENLPDTSAPGSRSRVRDEEWMTEKRAEEALSHIDASCSYEQWRNIGFALADEFNDSTALRLFESWSRRSSKWDDEAERLAERIITDSKAGEGVTIGTVVYHAQEGGWDPNLSGDGGPPLWKQQVAKNSDRYDDVDEVPNDPAELPRPGKIGDGEDGDEEGSGEESGTGDRSRPWVDVKSLYATAQTEKEFPKGRARQSAARVLEEATSWMFVVEAERLWVYDEESGTYNRFGRARAARILESNLGEYYSRTEAAEIIDRVEKRNQVHRKELNASDEDDELLCVGNGVVNLRTGDLLDHDPKYRFIRGLPWRYDPDDADRESILSFLDDVTERECDRATFLDHLAHGLMPGHPYRAFVVCYGPGGNGKTQVAELFRGFVGRENAAAVEIDELAGDDYASGDLPGAFINWGDDMAGDGGGSLNDLSVLKKATGGSEIRANEKYEKKFNFKSEAAMFFSANEPPRIGEQKDSIADRIYPIEMPYRFKAPEEVDPDDPLQKEKTPNIAETLLSDDAAMRGLLALAVEHAQELIENRGEYSQPESPSERLAKYQRTSDPIAKFAARALEPADDDMRIRKDDAYRVFRSFAQSWDERPASERGFKRQLPAKFPGEIETAQSRALAMPDDESERVRCWKRVSWTDRAKREMPDWLRERYADHFASAREQPGSSGGTRRSGDNTPELAAIEPGRHDLTVTVAELMEPKPWQQARGHVVDDSGNIMQFVAEGTNNPVGHVEEDDRVRITQAKVATDRDGLMQIEISGICDVEVINRDAEQAGLDDGGSGGGGETAADGGHEENAEGTNVRKKCQRIAEEIVGDAQLTKIEIQNVAADKFGWRLETTADLIEAASSEYGYLEQLGDEYRRT
jgi:putative DNA primase/helicase